MGLRILAVNWQDLENPFAGGAEVHLQEILGRLACRGHRVTLLCCGFPGGAPIEEYDRVRVIRRGRRINFNWVVPWHFRRLLREEPYDVILEDINKIPFYLPLFTRLPVLAVVPHLFATTVFEEVNPILATYVYLMEHPVSWLYRRCRWMVISESTAADLGRRGILAEQISVIHCGIDHALYRPDPAVARFAQPTILYLGRLKKYKSVHHLLQAAARLPNHVGDWRVVIVGEGDDRPRLERIAAELGIGSRVTFTGYVDTAIKVDYLRRSHVAVCPSLKEGWGLTIIEANACGLPVIAADVPGLRDSVQGGATGMLYPHGDLETLTRQLTTLLTDQRRWLGLSAGGLRWADTFHWDEAAEKTETLLEKVVAERHMRGGRR